MQLIVDINRVREAREYLRSINRVPLEEILWVDGDTDLEVDPKWLADFKFMSLGHYSLIEFSKVVDGVLVPDETEVE